MALAVNVYDFLDKETNVGLKDLRYLKNNKVYTAMKIIEGSVLGQNLGLGGLLDKLTSGIQNAVDTVQGVIDGVMGAAQDVIDKITDAINSAVDFLLDLPFVGFVRDLLDTLVELDRQGVVDFISSSSSMGSVVFCNNLGVFQNLLDGYYIDPNILEGLFAALALDWSNRVCKSYSETEEYHASNKDVIDMWNPYLGQSVKPDTAFKDFNGLAAGFLNNKPRTINDFTHGVTKGIEGFSSAITTGKLKDYTKQFNGFYPPKFKKEATSFLKSKLFSRAVDEDLNKYKEALDEIENNTGYDREDIIRSSNLSRSKDALGSFLKNLHAVDISKINRNPLIPVEKTILDKLLVIQKQTNNADFSSRTHKSGQFANYDFDELFTIFTDDEIKFIKGVPSHFNSHRYNGMHPTSEVFIDEKAYRVRKKLSVTPVGNKTDDLTGKQPLPEILTS